MEKKQVDIESPVKVAGLTIIPVIRTAVYACQSRRGISLSALKAPLYVIIKDLEGTIKLFGIDGKEILPEQIISEHPEVKEALEKTLVERF